MQTRGFLILVAVTAAVLLIAVFSAATGDRGVSRAGPGEKALPALGPKLADLAWFRLTRGQTHADFAQVGASWLVVEKGNYPAAAAKVRQTLLSLADLTLVEPKTRRPELYPRLGVEDPDDGKSTLVIVQDTSGAKVAELIVGKGRQDRLGSGNDGVYVRRPGGAQSWLARGSLDLSGDVTSWLDRRILDIPSVRIASVSLTGEDGAGLVLTRAAPDGEFGVQNPPLDVKFKPAAALAEPAAALEALDLDDVRPASELPPPDSGVATASLKTFEGLVVNLKLVQRNKASWVAIQAVGSGPTEAEAAKINAKVAPWMFAVPEFKAKLLRTKLADVIESAKG